MTEPATRIYFIVETRQFPDEPLVFTSQLEMLQQIVSGDAGTPIKILECEEGGIVSNVTEASAIAVQNMVLANDGIARARAIDFIETHLGMRAGRGLVAA